MAEEEELELDVNQQKGSKTTTILLIVLILLVLVIGGVGAWLLLGKDSGESSASSDEAEVDEVLAPLHYLTMVPEFIVNFGPGSKVRYLQVDLQVATRDEDTLKTIGIYRPVLRNDILVILSGVRFDDLKDRSGKEALQKKLLNTINKVLVSAEQAAPDVENNDENSTDNTEHVDPDAAVENTEYVDADAIVEGPIENVYFTSFIMQ